MFCKYAFMCICVYVDATISYRRGDPAAKNIIFPGPGIVLEGSLETCAAGCVSCCSPEHIPSFGDGEQLCLLKCKFPLGAAAVAAAVAAVASPVWDAVGERRKGRLWE